MAKKVLPMEKEAVLNGYVEEIELDDGRLGLIIDDGDDEYFVVMDRIGRQLLEHVDEEIEAFGTITRKQGDLTFKVSRFQVMDYFEDDDDYGFSDMDEWYE